MPRHQHRHKHNLVSTSSSSDLDLELGQPSRNRSHRSRLQTRYLSDIESSSDEWESDSTEDSEKEERRRLPLSPRSRESGTTEVERDLTSRERHGVRRTQSLSDLGGMEMGPPLTRSHTAGASHPRDHSDLTEQTRTPEIEAQRRQRAQHVRRESPPFKWYKNSCFIVLTGISLGTLTTVLVIMVGLKGVGGDGHNYESPYGST
ncbi:hypothetical protein T439DRAFT_356897 [Meredithblackwellia eburnea MCA 4105]